MKNQGTFDYHKGKLALDQGKTVDAIHYFTKTLLREPDHSLAALALGSIYEKEEKLVEAYGVYKKYLSRDPSHSEILAKMVKILFMLEKFTEAIPYLQTLTHMDPEDLNLKVKLGVLYADAGRHSEAKNLFLEILQEVPTSDKVNFYLASVYSETQEYKQALAYYEQVEKESPYYQDALIQRAQLLSVLSFGLNDENEMEYANKLVKMVEEKSIELPQVAFSLKVVLVGYFERKREWSKGIDLLNSLKTDAHFTDNHSYYLATLYEKNKESLQAKLVAEDIVKKNPKHAHAWNFLGYYILETGGQLEEAYIYIKKALKISPKDPFIRDSLGQYYAKKGQFSLALKEFLFARELVRDDTTISKHLAELYFTMKNYTLAKQYFLEALKNDRQGEEKDAIQRQLDVIENQDRLPASTSSRLE
jgi:tetratricopeptide (TPR) repeat protein